MSNSADISGVSSNPGIQATPIDDEFHAHNAANWWAVETLWFAFTIPEKAMNGVFYLVNRPTMNVCSLHVNVFDASGYEPWEQCYWRDLWTLPTPASLSNFEMPEVGLKFTTLKPLTRYRLQYRDGDEIDVDMTWGALIEPRMSGHDHIDQFGRVTGTLVLHGERFAIDCLQMRDRSWKHRSDLEGVNGGYTYGLASKDSAFLLASYGPDEIKPIVGGWLLRDGNLQTIVSGERRVLSRSAAGQPLKVQMIARDAIGRELIADGEALSVSTMFVNGNIFAWDSVMRWHFDDQQIYGEDQDIWQPAKWRAFQRQRRARQLPATKI